MKEKLIQKRNQKGFTLMEMLIVVAIIAILVAIAIPVFNTQLEKARDATDDANLRSAKAVAVATYLTEGTSGTSYFDAVKGILVANKTDVAAAYGKGKSPDYTADIIEVVVTTDGIATCTFVPRVAA